MDFKRFAQVFYNLILILQVILAQLKDLMSEDINTPKAIRAAELNPVIKFKMGPFESLDDHFYISDCYVKSVKYNNRKMLERIIGLKNGRRPEQRRTGKPETFKWKKTDFEKQRRQLDWYKSNRTPINLINKSSELPDILVLISGIHNQIKKLKTLTKLLAKLRVELQEVEKFLTLESLESLMKFLKKNGLSDKAKNQIEMEAGNRFNKINNHTYITQYQIENLFIFNRLSEENNSNLKEAILGIFNELTTFKVKELLEEVVINLNGNRISQGDIFAVAQASLQKSQMDLLEQLQRNFLKIFHSQNVTLKHIHQMSKIVDFVERYHGTVSDLKNLSVQVNEDRKNINIERSNEKANILHEFLKKCKIESKVLVGDGFDIFGSESSI